MVYSDTLDMNGVVGEEEEEREGEGGNMEMGMAVLDFDMLCSAVALQNHKGKWTKLSTEEETEFVGEKRGKVGAAFRMWEGEVFNCLDDRRIAIQSTCCPCYRFGRNMKRAGFGSCLLQGSVYFLLTLAALLNIVAFLITSQHRYLFFAIGFTLSIGLYLGIFRSQIRKKFNIRDNNSVLNDCIVHIACPCCSLFQESKTLELNNVHNGVWHGPADTIFIGGSLDPPCPAPAMDHSTSSLQAM